MLSTLRTIGSLAGWSASVTACRSDGARSFTFTLAYSGFASR